MKKEKTKIYQSYKGIFWKREIHIESEKESSGEDALSSVLRNPLNNTETHSKVLRIKALFVF